MSKLFGGLVAKFGLLVSASMIAGGVYFSAIKKDNFGDCFKRPAHVVEICDEDYSIPVKDEFGKFMQEKLRITMELDKEDNVLYLGNYTQDYDTKDWSGTEKELLPTNQRHTGINHVYSKTFILHPSEVKITNQEQIAFLIPNYAWDKNLKPYEKHKEAQMAIEGGEKIIDWALGQIPIPFFHDFIKQGIENATEKEKEYYETLFEKIKKGYTATIIPSQIPNKLFGYTETARESKISFDTHKLKEKAQIYLWTKIALGNPTKSADNSFPNKYGELENVVIEFSLGREKEKETAEKLEVINKELDWYFLQGKELEGISLTQDSNFGGTNKENPFILSQTQIDEWELEYLKSAGFASYTIADGMKNAEIIMEIQETFSGAPETSFSPMKSQPKILERLGFYKDNTFIFVMCRDIETKEQATFYVNSLINYHKRTGVKIITKEYAEESLNNENFHTFLEETKSLMQNHDDDWSFPAKIRYFFN
ncbi:hypothetical protein KAR52_02755 [Candidatus Pacearchaeota archaeon]|nr:hypothetical protein [Candidatus Pacearchaeota archaeon]